MLIYRRPQVKYGKNKLHIVYESIEEAIKYGVEITVEAPYKLYDWIAYGDGKVAQILRVQTTDKSPRILYWTILNQFIYIKRSGDFSGKKYGVYLSQISVFKDELNLNEITPGNLEFATDWLFRGMSLEEAVAKNYSDVLPQITTVFDKTNGNRPERARGDIVVKGRVRASKALAHIILSGHWFDKLIKTNRLFRDKYMSLVNVFENAGITKEAVAEALKRNMDSDNPKASIPAIKMALDVFQVDETRKASKQLAGGVDSDLRKLLPIEDAQIINPHELTAHSEGLEKVHFHPQDQTIPEKIETPEELEKLLIKEGMLDPLPQQQEEKQQ